MDGRKEGKANKQTREEGKKGEGGKDILSGHHGVAIHSHAFDFDGLSNCSADGM